MALGFHSRWQRNNNWFTAYVFQSLEGERFQSITSEVSTYSPYTSSVADWGSWRSWRARGYSAIPWGHSTVPLAILIPGCAPQVHPYSREDMLCSLPHDLSLQGINWHDMWYSLYLWTCISFGRKSWCTSKWNTTPSTLLAELEWGHGAAWTEPARFRCRTCQSYHVGSAKEPLWEVSALNHPLEESTTLHQPWRKPKKTSLLCPELAFVITFVNHLSSINYMALCSANINSAVNISECLACRLVGVLHVY